MLATKLIPDRIKDLSDEKIKSIANGKLLTDVFYFKFVKVVVRHSVAHQHQLMMQKL